MTKTKKKGVKRTTSDQPSASSTATPPPVSTAGPSTPRSETPVDPINGSSSDTTPQTPPAAAEVPAEPSEEAAQPVGGKEEADKFKEEGNVAFKGKKYEDAIRLYSKAIETYSLEPAYYSNRAAALIAQSKFRSALEDCQQAQSLQGSTPNIRTLLRLARCQLATGSPGPALSTLRSIQALETTNNDNQELYRLKNKAEATQEYLDSMAKARDAQDWAKASLHMDRVLSLVEGHGRDIPSEWRSWAISFKLARRQFDGALEAVRDAQRHEANAPDLMALRGKIMFLMNKTSEAIPVLKQALVFDPEHSDARKMFRRVKEFERIKEEGNKAFKSGKWQEAVDKYQEALDVVGERSEEGGGGIVRAILLSNRALASMKMGSSKYDDALEDLDKSLELFPEGWKALRTRARIKLEKDLFDEAIADFASAISFVEGDGAVDSSVAHSLEEEKRKAEVLLKRSKEKDYYKILNLERSCTEIEIKKAYRKESLLHHPDKGGDEEKFKLVSEAYAVLSDSEKRRRYDAGEDVDGQMGAGGNPFGAGGFPPGMMEQMLFAQMFGGGGGFPGHGGGGGGRRGHGHSHGGYSFSGF